MASDQPMAFEPPFPKYLPLQLAVLGWGENCAILPPGSVWGLQAMSTEAALGVERILGALAEGGR